MSAHWLNQNLREVFAVPEDARDWLLMLWNVIQVFDDMADGDHPDREALETAIADSLVNMPCNPFFLKNGHILAPLMSVAILKWMAADRAERSGNANAMSFAWRAGFYDIVLAVIHIVHGDEVARNVCMEVMNLYGEDYAVYLGEFNA